MTSKRAIAARDADRNIGEELLQAIRDIKGGKYGAEYSVEANDVVEASIPWGPPFDLEHARTLSRQVTDRARKLLPYSYK